MSDTAEPPVGASHALQPFYFQLLCDQDLDELHSLLDAIRHRSTGIIAAWYRLYVAHFGDGRSLSQTEFANVFEPIILEAESDLLRKDMEGYTRKLLRLGEKLAEHRVTLQELIAALHLFEEVVQAVVPDDAQTLRTCELFDKLSHVRIIVLVDAYVRSQTALAGTRIKALELEAAHLAPSMRTRFRGLVGKSAAMRRLYEEIEAAAVLGRPAMVMGEAGTEMELVARAVHESGERASSPFVALDCATLPEDLIDSELFGYRHEGFNGHPRDYLGLFRAAEGGTLFLRDLVETPPATQARLVRALREGVITPVGSTREVAVNARFIASTAHDPASAVLAGRLAPELHHELSGLTVAIPALRERLDDLPLLAEHFIDLFNEKFERDDPPTTIAEEALGAMARYPWPRNLHELGEVLRAAFIAATSPTVGLADLPPAIREKAAPGGLEMPSFAEAERDLIRRALDLTGGNKSSAARMLKISRKKLYGKLTKYRFEAASGRDGTSPAAAARSWSRAPRR